MSKNLLLFYRPANVSEVEDEVEDVEDFEKQLIDRFTPPLNIQNNPDNIKYINKIKEMRKCK